MKTLVFGGTRFSGVHCVNKLLQDGHDITIANRGLLKDNFGDKVKRIIADRTREESMKQLSGLEFDAVIDSNAYSSNDVKLLLDNIKTPRYISISTVSVYGNDLSVNTTEDSFDPYGYKLVWCNRQDFDYCEVKRQAEAATYQVYGGISSTSIRFPFIVGTDDYTRRFIFYVDHIMNEKPFSCDNIDAQIGFINSKTGGEFLAGLLNSQLEGPVNCASGSKTLREIFAYIEEKTGKKPIFSNDNPATYNGGESFTLCLSKAQRFGFNFGGMDFIYQMIDSMIDEVKNK